MKLRSRIFMFQSKKLKKIIYIIGGIKKVRIKTIKNSHSRLRYLWTRGFPLMAAILICFCCCCCWWCRFLLTRFEPAPIDFWFGFERQMLPVIENETSDSVPEF